MSAKHCNGSILPGFKEVHRRPTQFAAIYQPVPEGQSHAEWLLKLCRDIRFGSVFDVADVWNRAGSRHGGARLYPMVNVRDIESGKVRATRELMGAD